MVVCNFFQQGRCRYGDRCWNEHPGARGGRRQQHQPPPQRYQGSNRGAWNTQPDHYTSGAQSHNPYKWSSGSSRDGGKTAFGTNAGLGTQDGRNKSSSSSSASGFSFSQNKFSALSSSEDGRSPKTEEADLLDAIAKDMESWESSGQWMFSTYSVAKEKPNLSGFEDLSPEELCLEYFTCRADGNLQNYVNAVQQLANRWMNRIQELKNPTSSTKAALISELKKPVGETKSAFGFERQQAPTFISTSFPTNSATSSSASTFSFKPQSDFSSTAGGSPPNFGSLSTIQSHMLFPSAPSSSVTVSFGSTSSSTPTPIGFGSAAPSGFGLSGFSGFAGPSTTTSATCFSAVNSASATSVALGSMGTTVGSSFLGHPPGQSGASAGHNAPATTSGMAGLLFTPLTELSAGELQQFQAKRFTLGRIPLKPPPAELLVI